MLRELRICHRGETSTCSEIAAFFHEPEQATGAFSPEVSKHWVTISHEFIPQKTGWCL